MQQKSSKGAVVDEAGNRSQLHSRSLYAMIVLLDFLMRTSEKTSDERNENSEAPQFSELGELLSSFL